MLLFHLLPCLSLSILTETTILTLNFAHNGEEPMGGAKVAGNPILT